MRRLLAICCAVVFLDATFFAALAPLLPDYRHDFALSAAGTGVLSGSYAAGVLLFAMPGGWLAARYGSRRAVLVGLVGMGGFSLIFGFAQQIWLLDASRFMQGAAGALMWAGAMSWVIISGPEDRRGALVGTLVAAATVGELLGAPIGALAHFAGTEIVFGSVAIVSAGLYAAALTVPNVPPRTPQPPADAWRATAHSQLPSAMWLLAAAAFAFGVATVVAPLRLDELGGTAALIAAAFASASVVETIVGPQVGKVSDRVGRARPYRLGMVVGSAAVLVVCLLDSRLLVAAGVVFFAFAAGLAFTPSIALTADAAEAVRLDQGYASGISNVAWGGGQMLGAFGGGALAGVSFLLPALVTIAVLASAGVVAARIIGHAAPSLGSAP